VAKRLKNIEINHFIERVGQAHMKLLPVTDKNEKLGYTSTAK
jgi:hypothetical protein